MLSAELDYELPAHFIAQTPIEPRDAARLLHLNAQNGQLSDHFVRDLPDLLRAGDLLIFNDTRVLRARILGAKLSGGRVEALLLREIERNLWEAMLKPSARLQIGSSVWFGNAETPIEAVLKKRTGATWEIEFHVPERADLREFLSRIGEVPLPPYIHEKAPEERYQTTFARPHFRRDDDEKPLDSAAAPTAGLHFTPQLLQKLGANGIESAFVTLAVGAGTFAPVKTENLDDHPMHSEAYEIAPAVAARINEHKKNGGRIVAVGTTAVRTLESAVRENGEISSGWNQTALFLRPGADFRIVDALITNFHLPRSTLLALVAAFIENRARNGENGSKRSGVDAVRASYAHAMKNDYRFFSFGDAMLIE